MSDVRLTPADVGARYGVSNRVAMRIMRCAGAFSISGTYGADWRHLRIAPDVLDAFDARSPLEFIDPASEFVCYAIRAGEYVKLGYASDIVARLSKIRESNPIAELLLTLPGGIGLEAKLHAHFHDQRFRGEWFHYDGELKAFIESVLVGGGK